jgi:hypothetical protein
MSSHGVDAITGTLLQTPPAHESVVHALPSLQFMPVPPQTPAVHTSFIVQLLPSSHIVPLRFECTQPMTASHVSAVHALLSSQFSAEPPVHMPAMSHVVLVVHALLSLHIAPLFGTLTQPAAATHVSSVHVFMSLQFTAVPTHEPEPLH